MSDLDEEDKYSVNIPYDDPADTTGKAIYEKTFTDMLIHAKVLLPQRENVKSTKVQGITKDDDGKMVGTFESNQIFNTIIYDVDFPDGAVKQYAANVIAENMYIQVDSYGNTSSILDVIVDYSKDDTAVPIYDKYVTTRSGTRRLLHTTEGWQLLVRQKYGSEKWVSLKLLKEQNPVEISEFAQSRDIYEKPAFYWWVPYTFRKKIA